MEYEKDYYDFRDDYSSMSASQYLTHFHIDFFLNDLFRTIRKRDRNSTEQISQTAADFFASLIGGDHVIGRDFDYLSSSPRNRRCFVRHLNQNVETLRGSAVTCTDFHDLLSITCPDMPMSLVRDAAIYADKAKEHQPTVSEMCKPDGGWKDSSEAISQAAETANFFLSDLDGVPNPPQPPSVAMTTVYDFDSLLKMFTVFFVYNEFLSHVKTVFKHFGGGAIEDDPCDDGLPAPFASGLVDRGLLLDEMRRKAVKVYGVAFPCDSLMQELFQSTGEAVEEEVQSPRRSARIRSYATTISY